MPTAAAELVRDFVNTYDVEGDVDEFSSPAELSVWLRERSLIGESDRATEEDLFLAVHLREGLRAALRRNHDPAADDGDARLEKALRAMPLRVTVAEPGPRLVPARAGVAGGLGAVAAAVMAAHGDGMWPRLKVCAEGTCRWAFIDSSKNRSRAWCSMKVCGNRTKTRAYRARRGGDPRTRRS